MLRADDVVRAAAALGPLGAVDDADRAWSERTTAGWTAGRTVEHLGDALLYYAGQVARRATDRLPPLRDGRAGPPSEQLELVRTAAYLFAGQLRDLGDGRAWHPSGLADAEGWTGMAVTELLVHGWDAAGLLGVSLELPGELCARTMARTFPWVDLGLAPSDQLLLAVTGRIEVVGVPSDPEWWWQSAPLTEWDGRPRRRTVPPAWS